MGSMDSTGHTRVSGTDTVRAAARVPTVTNLTAAAPGPTTNRTARGDRMPLIP
jgi:hypothetical protein